MRTTIDLDDKDAVWAVLDKPGETAGWGARQAIMSETFDVNVLVHATHRASPFHEGAKAVVERFLAGPGLVYLRHP